MVGMTNKSIPHISFVSELIFLILLLNIFQNLSTVLFQRVIFIAKK